MLMSVKWDYNVASATKTHPLNQQNPPLSHHHPRFLSNKPPQISFTLRDIISLHLQIDSQVGWKWRDCQRILSKMLRKSSFDGSEHMAYLVKSRLMEDPRFNHLSIRTFVVHGTLNIVSHQLITRRVMVVQRLQSNLQNESGAKTGLRGYSVTESMSIADPLLSASKRRVPRMSLWMISSLLLFFFFKLILSSTDLNVLHFFLFESTVSNKFNLFPSVSNLLSNSCNNTLPSS